MTSGWARCCWSWPSWGSWSGSLPNRTCALSLPLQVCPPLMLPKVYTTFSLCCSHVCQVLGSSHLLCQLHLQNTQICSSDVDSILKSLSCTVSVAILQGFDSVSHQSHHNFVLCCAHSQTDWMCTALLTHPTARRSR